MHKDHLTRSARIALLDHGPSVLSALDRMIAAAKLGTVAQCEHCGLRKVENFRNEQVRVQLLAMRERIEKFIVEAQVRLDEAVPR